MYKLVTPIETRIALSGTIVVSMKLMKSVVSFRYDFCFCSMGLSSLGVGMNFNPFASKLIWSFVSSTFERFLMCPLFTSVCACNRSARLFFLRVLCFFFCAQDGFVFPHPLLIV